MVSGMANARLAIEERRDRYTFQIGWFLPEDGDFGLMLGETWNENKNVTRDKADQDDPEHWDAEHAVAPMATSRANSCGAFEFESRSAAQKALAAAKAAIGAGKENRPMEEWEKIAIANGWKPPKGWKGAVK